MATRRCCSGCSGSNHCYGALNCVAGPYNCRNYPYYTGPCAQVSCTDNCGNTTNNCNCNHNCNCTNNCSNNCTNSCNCHHHCCHHRPCWYPCDFENTFPPVMPDPNPPTPSLPPPAPPAINPTSAYGFFNAAPPVTIAAGGVVPLETNLANDRFFTNTGGSILIRRAGAYLVSYSVQVPAGETLASQYYLTLNGTAIDETALNVTDDGAEETESYTIQAIIQATANSTLTLNSSNAVTLEATALNPFNLTIVRLA